MALSPGTRLGPYEVTAQIGVGGMGEVYRAIDTNLKRSVAIKVLPPSVAADTERLARFQREAEVLGAFNHPHIAQIHGLEKSDGTIALVMELVEGSTLADRIAQGAIPIDEALPIAKQIAEALEAAHEQGIIHRDLKPANVKVRSDGTVKVLDFGLAKAMEPASALRASAAHALSQSPTITTPAMTQAGIILGTAAYMSPEQARPVQPRHFDELLDAGVNDANPVRLLEERVRCAVRRCEQDDLPGVCGDALERRRGRRERRAPHEEHAVDATQTRVERVGRGEITGHGVDVRRQVDRARVTAHGANPATCRAQLRDHLAANLAGRAGNEDVLHWLLRIIEVGMGAFLYSLALVEPGGPVQTFCEGFQWPGISMRSFVLA